MSYVIEESTMSWIVLAVLLVLIMTGLFTVRQQTVAIVERFGRFKKASRAGLNFKIPLIDQIAGRVNLRVQQLDVQVETKTKDNVFVFVIVSVQYFVPPEKVVDAFYKLQNPQEQITAYVFDTVRARVPAVNLDQLFEMKDDIATAVKAELDSVMDDFGYGIVKALVTDINPDEKVKVSMNEINAAQRLREAASSKLKRTRFGLSRQPRVRQRVRHFKDRVLPTNARPSSKDSKSQSKISAAPSTV